MVCIIDWVNRWAQLRPSFGQLAKKRGTYAKGCMKPPDISLHSNLLMQLSLVGSSTWRIRNLVSDASPSLIIHDVACRVLSLGAHSSIFFARLTFFALSSTSVAKKNAIHPPTTPNVKIAFANSAAHSLLTACSPPRLRLNLPGLTYKKCLATMST